MWRSLTHLTDIPSPEPPFAIFIVKIFGSLFLHFVIAFGNMKPPNDNLPSRANIVCHVVSTLVPINLKYLSQVIASKLKVWENITSLISTPDNGGPTLPVEREKMVVIIFNRQKDAFSYQLKCPFRLRCRQLLRFLSSHSPGKKPFVKPVWRVP